MRNSCVYMTCSVVALLSGGAGAAESPSSVFTLGQINVSAQTGGQPIGGASLSAEEILTFNKPTLDQALDLVPGVVSSTTGGQRNERLVYVRGFDRFQIPLSLDGVRVYLPADNRLDFGRFLTPDLSEIQVSKGYASVLDGPGAMGGAINLVTRKPTREFEGELRAGLSFDNDAAFGGYTTYGSVGTRQERFYLQASGTKTETTHTGLPDDFKAVPSENGGNRNQSHTADWRVNLKAGFTPNDTDEYSVNVLKQSGSKGAPLNVNDTTANQRYWSWPYWDLQSVYWLSNTKLGSASYAKTKLYYNTFQNGLYSFDDPGLTRQTLARSFRSYYDDKAYGGSLELGTDLIPMNTLKGALHVRRDDHREWQRLYPGNFVEPKQQALEDTWSVALENSVHVTDALDVVLGVSHDWRRLHKAQDWNGTATGSMLDYKRADSDATNGQGAVIHRFSKTGEAHASVSARSRFPSLFERFSTRFNGTASNPDLKPERAINYEVGASERFGSTRIEGALFLSRLRDVIANAPIVINGQATTQSRNMASGLYRGFEVGVSTSLTPMLDVGGNYTLTIRSLSDPAVPNMKAVGTPNHKVFLHADWRPTDSLTVVPSVEAASGRYSQSTSGTVFLGNGGYLLANLQASYALTANAELSAGVRNLFDSNYSLADGFPEPGRTAFVTARYTF
ncbi:TonB-dependent receptor [Azospirillum doebereinerae]|uniref:TonB-dependent receptor n=1 Tax=Azospirillum doebereinerae TaxID=92933 RepID=A0A433J109_9PROT|nr:TonB-dependent receptor [Azospirillum doebereinerae]